MWDLYSKRLGTKYINCNGRKTALKKSSGTFPSIVLGSPVHKNPMDLLLRDQWGATRMMKGLQHLSHEERQGELGMFSLETRVQGDPIT